VLDFELFIGIDYSGAETSTSPLKGLQVAAARSDGAPPVLWTGPRQSNNGRPVNWSRREIAERLLDEMRKGTRFLAGIDHGFSFPLSYFSRYGLSTWPDFLADFVHHWPTHRDYVYVDFVRDGNLYRRGESPPPESRTGDSDELRLTERWTSSAKSVFLFDVQGSVAKSTHAGLPWLHWLREQAGDRLHVWPFDGWAIPHGKSVLAEVYPSLFRHRYDREGRTADQQDAYATARWMQEMQARGALPAYLLPPLTLAERSVAALEGWILGVG
jgi:hypothetical protein